MESVEIAISFSDDETVIWVDEKEGGSKDDIGISWIKAEVSYIEFRLESFMTLQELGLKSRLQFLPYYS